ICLGVDIGDIGGGVDALDKSRAESFDGGADARHFGEIDTGAHDHLSPAPVMVSRPCLTPLVLMRMSATLRTSPALPRTTSTSRQLSWSRCTCKVERMERWKSCWMSVSLSLNIRTWWL